MNLMLILFRILVFLSFIVVPGWTQNFDTRGWLSVGILLLLFSSLLIHGSLGYIKMWPGRLELIGLVSLMVKQVVVMLLIEVSGSAELGFIGAILAMIGFIALVFCWTGMVAGLIGAVKKLEK